MNPTKADITALIRTLAPLRDLDPEILTRQCEAESSFNQAARSSCGAVGLMQLTPICVKDLAQRFHCNVDPADWRENLMGGITAMCYLLRHFGTYDKALAAYNWGEGAVSKVLAEHPEDWREHLPAETKGYLSKILGDAA